VQLGLPSRSTESSASKRKNVHTTSSSEQNDKWQAVTFNRNQSLYWLGAAVFISPGVLFTAWQINDLGTFATHFLGKRLCSHSVTLLSSAKDAHSLSQFPGTLQQNPSFKELNPQMCS
jgi:hypothetical protein